MTNLHLQYVDSVWQFSIPSVLALVAFAFFICSLSAEVSVLGFSIKTPDKSSRFVYGMVAGVCAAFAYSMFINPAPSAVFCLRSQDPATCWYERGVGQLALGDYGQSAYSFKAAVELDSSLTQAWYGHGITMQMQALNGDAIASFNKAILNIPNCASQAPTPDNDTCADIWFAKGNSLYHLERYEAALAAYDRVIQLQPERSPLASTAWNNKGAVHEALGNLQAALPLYQEAIRLYPDNIEARNNLRRAGVTPEEQETILATDAPALSPIHPPLIASELASDLSAESSVD
jgi:tetratricopeptide (TPR) repeat protein